MSEEPNDGGPAFPSPSCEDLSPEYGMSLRDWFAGQALTGFIVARCLTTDDAGQADDERKRKAKSAYRIADAMLAARARGSQA